MDARDPIKYFYGEMLHRIGLPREAKQESNDGVRIEIDEWIPGLAVPIP
jgi:hypothetical protein